MSWMSFVYLCPEPTTGGTLQITEGLQSDAPSQVLTSDYVGSDLQSNVSGGTYGSDAEENNVAESNLGNGVLTSDETC